MSMQHLAPSFTSSLYSIHISHSLCHFWKNFITVLCKAYMIRFFFRVITSIFGLYQSLGLLLYLSFILQSESPIIMLCLFFIYHIYSRISYDYYITIIQHCPRGQSITLNEDIFTKEKSLDILERTWGYEYWHGINHIHECQSLPRNILYVSCLAQPGIYNHDMTAPPPRHEGLKKIGQGKSPLHEKYELWPHPDSIRI